MLDSRTGESLESHTGDSESKQSALALQLFAADHLATVIREARTGALPRQQRPALAHSVDSLETNPHWRRNPMGRCFGKYNGQNLDHSTYLKRMSFK